MDYDLDLMPVLGDPLLDRKASLVVRTSLILLDFVLPYYFQVLLNPFLGFYKVGLDEAVFVATAFLVENFKRFAL